DAVAGDEAGGDIEVDAAAGIVGRLVDVAERRVHVLAGKQRGRRRVLGVGRRRGRVRLQVRIVVHRIDGDGQVVGVGLRAGERRAVGVAVVVGDDVQRL